MDGDSAVGAITHWQPLPAPPVVRLAPGRYRAPDGREGIIHGYDEFAYHYSFEPDGFVPPAILVPGRSDGRVRFGLEEAHKWVRIGDLPELRRSASIEISEDRIVHYASAVPTCAGGRDDTGDWAAVTCPDCLQMRHPCRRGTPDYPCESCGQVGHGSTQSEGLSAMHQLWRCNVCRYP